MGESNVFTALHMTTNDCERAMNIDLGGYKQILASRQIYKYRIHK